jgi:hypothetical protein
MKKIIITIIILLSASPVFTQSPPEFIDDFTVNGIYPGLSQAEAEKLFESAAESKQEEDYTILLFEDVVIKLLDGKVQRFSTRSDQFESKLGISVGDSIETLQTIYTGLRRENYIPKGGKEVTELRYVYSQQRGRDLYKLIFRYEEETIVEIAVEVIDCGCPE